MGAMGWTGTGQSTGKKISWEMGPAEWPSSICVYMYIHQKQAVPSLIDTLPSGEEKQKLGHKGG